MKVAIITALFVTLLGASQALDKCPDVKFVENFDGKRFLGVWHGIQTVGIDKPCISYDVVEADKPNNFRALLSPAKVYVELNLKGENFSEGFTTSSTIESLNNANMRIPYTDYDNYAVVTDCKATTDGIHLVTTFASRTKTLDKELLEKLKTEMTTKYGIDFSDTKIVEQEKC